jgi:hypothetical protein
MGCADVFGKGPLWSFDALLIKQRFNFNTEADTVHTFIPENWALGEKHTYLRCPLHWS